MPAKLFVYNIERKMGSGESRPAEADYQNFDNFFKSNNTYQQLLEENIQKIPGAKPASLLNRDILDWIVFSPDKKFLEGVVINQDILNQLKGSSLVSIDKKYNIIETTAKLLSLKTTGAAEPEIPEYGSIIGGGATILLLMDVINVILVVIIIILTYFILKELGCVEKYLPTNEENMTPYRPLISS